MKPKCIIVDIDGTIADIGHRLHFIRDGKKDWDGFFAAAKDDAPVENVIVIVNNLALSLGVELDLIVVSGRPERTREATSAWLHVSGVSVYDELFMRPDGDHRPDHIVKEEILDRDILPHWDVLCSIDDRNQVVAMWRRRGITCLQVRDGDY